MRNMKVCLVALVILVSNQATAQKDERTSARQAKQLSLSEPEQKYDLELSFPVDSDEATNVDDGRRERIDQLIQEILSNEALVSRKYNICVESDIDVSQFSREECEWPAGLVPVLSDSEE